MRTNTGFPITVAVLVLMFAALYLSFGHMKHEREIELARLTGDDDQSQAIRAELDEYRMLNERQQRGILITGSFVVLIVAVWWMKLHIRNRP